MQTDKKCGIRRFSHSSRDYNVPVYVQHTPDATEGSGEPAESDWQDRHKIYCRIKYSGSKEVDFANRQDARVNAMAWARFNKTSWRVKSTERFRIADDVHGDRVFQIVGPPVNVDEKNDEVSYRLSETTDR
tara:strand:+ start:910 stop:1302 length:393 start_codon:yes stop_codon:yes gene_type:complete